MIVVKVWIINGDFIRAMFNLFIAIQAFLVPKNPKKMGKKKRVFYTQKTHNFILISTYYTMEREAQWYYVARSTRKCRQRK